MDGIVLLDHLDRRAAILGNLVDIGAFDQSHADIGMA